MSALQVTPRQANELAMLVFALAIAAPGKFSRIGHRAVVPRDLVRRARAQCEELGLDWRAVHKEIRRKPVQHNES